jgi:hypothetical protein
MLREIPSYFEDSVKIGKACLEISVILLILRGEDGGGVKNKPRCSSQKSTVVSGIPIPSRVVFLMNWRRASGLPRSFETIR